MVKEFILPEMSVKHEEKKSIEKEYFEGYEDFLKEKNWEKISREDIEEIERKIDEGLEKKKNSEKIKKEEKIEKEVIYSSKRGYIVKVTSTEEGETKVSYYLITKIEDIEEALDRISSYKPIIEEGEDKRLLNL
ncbi:MAG TPA: hypothetical protein ENI33_01570 [Thermoplasmatales archaeon]|nr:hypothetical protein [Thermoplasmatales archaeon]